MNNTVMGFTSDANGSCNTIIGYNNKAIGDNNTIIGNNNDIMGTANIISGVNNKINGGNNIIHAHNLILVGNDYIINKIFNHTVYINNQLTYNILLFFYNDTMLINDVIIYFLKYTQHVTNGQYCYHHQNKFILI